MKKTLLIFIMLCLSLQYANSQSSTQSATFGTTSPSSACLSCPGSIWNNEMNVAAADGIPSDIGLMQNGFCFQSTCYYSRFLESSQFGFAIPGTATIVGIEVSILRNSPGVNIIKDTVVQLLRNGVTASSNYMASVYWPLAYTTQVYGGPTDLWGLAWTPGAINNPATAVDLKIYNQSASSQSGINVDHVTMTVYYSTATGVLESQTSSPFSFYANQTAANELTISFMTSKISQEKISLYDLNGKNVYSKELGGLNEGQHTEVVSTENLSKGTYLIVLQSTEGVRTKKVILE